MKTNLNILDKNLSAIVKDLGFDYEVLYYYDNGELVKMDDWSIVENYLPAPMFMNVAQWLREEKDITIFPIRIGNVTIPNLGYAFITYFPEDAEPKFVPEPHETEEEAMIEGLKYVIKNHFKIEI